MSSTAEPTKLEDEVEERKGDWPVLGGRIHPDSLRMVEVAAAFVGQKKADFAVEAAVARARDVLTEKAPETLAHFPAP